MRDCHALSLPLLNVKRLWSAITAVLSLSVINFHLVGTCVASTYRLETTSPDLPVVGALAFRKAACGLLGPLEPTIGV